MSCRYLPRASPIAVRRAGHFSPLPDAEIASGLRRPQWQIDGCAGLTSSVQSPHRL